MDFLGNVGAEVVGGVILAILAIVWRVVVTARARIDTPPAQVAPTPASDAVIEAAVDPCWWATAKDLLWGAFVASVLLLALGVSWWLVSFAAGAFASLVRSGTDRVVAAWRGGRE